MRLTLVASLIFQEAFIALGFVSFRIRVSSKTLSNVSNLLVNNDAAEPFVQFKIPEGYSEQNVGNHSQESRRVNLSRILTTTGLVIGMNMNIENGLCIEEAISSSEDKQKTDSLKPFRSGGFGREEYTNSFVASRDTNISPKEAYDTITTAADQTSSSSSIAGTPLLIALHEGREPRALDFGCGAGVSTQILWDMGYRQIDAVDWSADAWDRFVIEDPLGYCPLSVHFHVMDDERYRQQWQRIGGKDSNNLFDFILYNFAVNDSKARDTAAEMLVPGSGRLLAPVNIQSDYWLKQEYRIYDSTSQVLWKAAEIGAWSVQFQPDVTQDSCQGIWCAPFNGFKKSKI